MTLVRVYAVLAAGLALPAHAQDAPRLALPIQCNLGQTCWVANYVDVDTTSAARDFTCRARAYDGHDGVDFAIRDLGAMRAGVPVLASLAGVVKNVRDGMPDAAIADAASRARIKGRECGNGVVIDHPGGWQTQYCHLRTGSVRVKPGEQVAAGAVLGLVGLSGHTEFPHVHLAVRREGTHVDPFTGQTQSAGCGQRAQSLWRDDAELAYEHSALYNAGFDVGAPDINAIRDGRRNDGPFAGDAPALVMWVDMFGVQTGDRLTFRVTGPDGATLFEQAQRIEKTQARRFVYVGKKRTVKAWARGTYAGEVTLLRSTEDGQTTTNVERSFDVR
jgi:hypothetical protein